MRYPDLICIGAQKSATTWLFQTLRKRNDIFLPRVKELNYFTQLHTEEAKVYGPKLRAEKVKVALKALDAKIGDGHDQTKAREMLEHIGIAEIDDSWYSKIFEYARADQKCVDICPSYMILPADGIKHVLGLTPNLALVLMVRDPVERAWSHIRMNIARGMTIENKTRILEGKGQLKPYLKMTDYASAIQLWEEQTKPGQLQIILHDQVTADPQSVINDLMATLGLPPSPPDKSIETRVFQGEKMEFTSALRERLLSTFKVQYDFLRPRFPETVSGWQKKHEQILSGLK